MCSDDEYQFCEFWKKSKKRELTLNDIANAMEELHLMNQKKAKAFYEEERLRNLLHKTKT